MDAGYVREVWRSERSSRGLDDGAFVDAREGQRAHSESDRASFDDRCGGMVAEHARRCHRAGRVLRCEGAKDFAKFHGKLKGAIVIYQEPASLSPPEPDDPHAQLSRPMQQPPARIGEAPAADPFEAFQKAAKERTEFWKQEGVAAVLRDSNKPHGLLNMTDVSLARYDIGPIPTAFVTGEG